MFPRKRYLVSSLQPKQLAWRYGASVSSLCVTVLWTMTSVAQAQSTSSFCTPPSGASQPGASATCGPGTTTTGVTYNPTGRTFTLTFAPNSTVDAANADAVQIFSFGTTTTIDASAPTIALRSGLAGNDGIYISGSNGGSVRFGGLIVSEIDHGIHVNAQGSGGTNDVAITNLSTGRVYSLETGLLGVSSGGDVTVTNNGSVTQGASTNTSAAFGTITIGSSTFSSAIVTSTSGTGETRITNTGSLVAEGGGIQSSTSGSGGISITNGGSITAANAGISASNSGGTPTSTLDIANLAGASITSTSSTAISAIWDGRVNITNAGAITGSVAIASASTGGSTGPVVTFDNQASGVFAASGTNRFGGSGVFNNDGVVTLQQGVTAGNTGPAAVSALVEPGISATFSGLSEFRNAGTINLANGYAGDRVAIEGNYVGQNGQLVLDFATQTSTADRLEITGNASGTTGITVSNLTSAVPFTNSAPLVVVNGQTTANAFSLRSAQNFGTIESMLMTNVENGVTTLSLGVVPTALGLAGPTATVAARTISFQGGQSVLDRMSQLRNQLATAQTGTPAIPAALQYAGLSQYTALVSKDPIAPKLAPPPAPSNVRPAVWARAFGDYESRSGFGRFTFGGGTFTRDLGYDQSSGGLLAGADVVISGLSGADDGLVLGVMAGYTTAIVRLNQGAGRQDFEGGTFGAYATYLKGPFFVDALFKVDVLGLDIIGPGLRQNTGLQNYNFTSNVGYRVPLQNGIYVEPTAGLEYVSTDFDRQTALTGGTVLLRDGDALRLRGGARFGYETIVDNTIRIEPNFTAYAYSVVSENGLNGAFNTVTAVTGLREEGRVRGELQASLNIFNLKTGVSGFIRADGRFGEDLVAGGGRAGIRYQW